MHITKVYKLKTIDGGDLLIMAHGLEVYKVYKREAVNMPYIVCNLTECHKFEVMWHIFALIRKTYGLL